MKKFILRTLAFLILATVVMVVLDLCLTSKLNKRELGPYACWNDIFHHNISADMLIMGSSRAWVHISPAILDSALHINSYNLGQNGSKFDRQYTRYLIYRKHNPKPKVILQTIDFYTLSATTGYEHYQYFPYFYDKDIRKLFFPSEPFTLADKTLPFYRYANFGVRNLFDDKRLPIKGYYASEKIWNTDTVSDDETIQSIFYPDVIDLFEQFLDETQKECIQVILVHTPIHASFTRHHIDLDEMWDKYNSIASKYNVPILNYQFDTLCENTDYFYNNMHLNREGAEIFTRQLAEDLKGLIKIEQ